MKCRLNGHGPATVVDCYSLFDKWFPVCGMLDYSDGMYHGDPATPYQLAQHNQLNYLLDQVGCAEGTRILEIGCGNGTLLDEVRKRKATGVGITISPEQVALCRRRGLDVRLLNYKDLDGPWAGRFDAVVANGPMEHFVQAKDAAEGRADSIYRQFFATCHRAIDPASPLRRFINTTIHFVRRPDPNDLLKRPLTFRPGSDSFHYSLLAHSFGGWYPEMGQLQRCADGYFDLLGTTDGTQDYYLTSEHWLREVRARLKTNTALKIVEGSLAFMLARPVHFLTMVTCMLVTESWNWQFRPPDPPTRLLRQAWAYCG